MFHGKAELLEMHNLSTCYFSLNSLIVQGLCHRNTQLLTGRFRAPTLYDSQDRRAPTLIVFLRYWSVSSFATLLHYSSLFHHLIGLRICVA